MHAADHVHTHTHTHTVLESGTHGMCCGLAGRACWLHSLTARRTQSAVHSAQARWWGWHACETGRGEGRDPWPRSAGTGGESAHAGHTTRTRPFRRAHPASHHTITLFAAVHCDGQSGQWGRCLGGWRSTLPLSIGITAGRGRVRAHQHGIGQHVCNTDRACVTWTRVRPWALHVRAGSARLQCGARSSMPVHPSHM